MEIPDQFAVQKQTEISQVQWELARAARKSRVWLQKRQTIQVQNGMDESPTSMTPSKFQLEADNLGKQAEMLKLEEEAIAARRELSSMAERLVVMEGKVLESNLTAREKQQPLEREIEMLKESVLKLEKDAIAARLASKSKDKEIAMLRAKALKSEQEAAAVRKKDADIAGKLAEAEIKIRELQDELKVKASSLRLAKQDVEALRLAKHEAATPEKLPQPISKIRDEQKLEQMESKPFTARLVEAAKEKDKFHGENQKLQSEVEALRKFCITMSEQHAKMSRMDVQTESPTVGASAGDASKAAAVVGRLRREILLLQAELAREYTSKKDLSQTHHPARVSILQQAGCLVQKLCCGANGALVPLQ